MVLRLWRFTGQVYLNKLSLPQTSPTCHGGLWESVAAGQIAEFVVEVEERSLDAKIGAGSIPPSARVRQLAAR